LPQRTQRSERHLSPRPLGEIPLSKSSCF
jgi:hypothetical protein